ncbi:MAG: 1,4-dihydroxy-2-naphthoate octaprenyltransferase [Flavobacteriales bacterium]|nr:1,4-dihydroxy-2-naphthoate octaprenyltransferase [Flavobacteriales bacterium]
MIGIWIKAFRLRTLPLAFSSIITGTALAFDKFDPIIFSLALATTLFLQVLSNLANDYGDAEKGTDNENRVGPDRAIQSGAISKSQMKKAIIIFVILSFSFGVSLVAYAMRNAHLGYTLFLLITGILSIVAAIKYTAGKTAYGYKGLGDLFVFIFFGLVGVLGSKFLYTSSFELASLLPAMTIGLFSVAVLNLNNMRDWENDKASQKNTLVVKIGLKKAKKYHFTILILGIASSIAYVLQIEFRLVELTFILAFIPVVLHLRTVAKIKNNPTEFDPELKKVALSTFLFSLLFLLSAIV